MNNITIYEQKLQEDELSQNTIDTYIISINQYFQEFSELNTANYLKYKKLLSERVSPKTVNLRLSAINKYIDVFELNCKKVKIVKVHKTTSIENVITINDYNKLVKMLKQDNDMKGLLIVTVLAKTGARISEALKITKKDIKNGYCDMYTKGKVRRLIIPKSILEDNACLLSEFKENDIVLVNRYKRPITSRGVSGKLQVYARKYNIDKSVMHPHSFRHFFAIQFLKSNGNISLLGDVLGHSNLNTTAIYTRMTADEQLKAVNKSVNW